MKNRKRNIIISLLFIDIVLSLILTGIFNFYISNYLDQEVKRSINIEANYYKNDKDVEYVDNYSGLESTFTAVALYTDFSYLTDENQYDLSYSYEFDNYFLRQCKINKDELATGSIVEIDVLKKKYYVKQVLPKHSRYGEEVILLYVNISPFLELVKKINILFGAVILVSAIGLCFVGLKAGEKLDDSDRKMKQFFENVSHELKTPIMSIQGYAEGIEHGVIQDTQKAARIILSESDRMTTMVNEILELSKLESGTLKADMVLNDMKEIIYESLDRITHLAEKANIKLEVNIEDSLDTNIYCDNDMIEKVILNILTNAIRYANNVVSVDLFDNEDAIKLRISDDGLALSQEDINRIFERFYRGEKGCTGVGLSLAKEIINLHNGYIYVETGDRTSFFVVLKKSQK